MFCCIVKRKPCLRDGTLTAELVRLVENPCVPIDESPNDAIEDSVVSLQVKNGTCICMWTARVQRPVWTYDLYVLHVSNFQVKIM